MNKNCDVDGKYTEKLKEEIKQLKEKNNAVIFAHNYQKDEIQDIADITGDSLALSKAAVNIDYDVIVFCGVHFMAESAAILNPDKTVLLPVKDAGCPMADMATVKMIKEYRRKYPRAAVVCYVNSSADVKAESDICCTSSNAVEVVKSLKEEEIIFVPDKNLGNYVKINVPDKHVILWPGFCPAHIRLMEEEILKVKKQYPEAEFIAHPECRPEVIKLADSVCSTAGMFEYAGKSSKKEFIIGTEKGLIYGLKKENPFKTFILPSKHLVCANMKLTTLGWVVNSLKHMEHKITVREDIRQRAVKALQRMLDIK